MATKGRVLITGIEGFTGSHLAKHMTNQGYMVFGMSLYGAPGEDNIFQVNISDMQSVKKVLWEIKPDFIIHLAGISFVPDLNVSRMYEVNVGGTLNILNACVELRLSPLKVVIASSATVYGEQSASVLDEDMCPAPNSNYACSKLSMEMMARNYFSELEILIVRPFNYTGPGQASHFLIPKLVEHYVQKKSEIKLGNIDVFREFNDVRYICQLYQLALQSEFKSTHVNFCTGYVYSINEIIEILSKVTNFKVTVKINRDLIRAHDIKSLSGSTRKLNRTLGKPAIDYSIESTLVSMIED